MSMQSQGVLVGAGGLPWENRQTGVVEDRPKIAVSSGVVTALPDLYDAEPDALKQAQSLPFGSPVVLEFTTTRFKQLVVRGVKRAG